MVDLKSNIDNIIKQYNKKIEIVKDTIQEIPNFLANEMIDEMIDVIFNDRDTWVAKESPLEYINATDFEIEKKDNSCIVHIGRNTQPIITRDGTKVNPYFFIEFGFGIRGEKNPQKNHELYYWEYNIRNHKRSWTYQGVDEDGSQTGNKIWTVGKKGINFLYSTMEKYKIIWKDIVMSKLKEAIENGRI